MTESATDLRVAVIGLASFAATEEAILVIEAGDRRDEGDCESWGALATIVHTSEFRDQQVQRLRAIRDRAAPLQFPRVDHRSADTYRRYSEPSASSVWELSRHTNAALIDETRRCSDEDLLDPGRNPWLEGRHLWLQIIVRGFWHPAGHLGDYYLQHGQPERALALHARALASAEYLGAPPMAVGMAHYGNACVLAVLGHTEDALGSLERAFACNPDLRNHARSEPDLRSVQESGRLTAMLSSSPSPLRT